MRKNSNISPKAIGRSIGNGSLTVVGEHCRIEDRPKNPGCEAPTYIWQQLPLFGEAAPNNILKKPLPPEGGGGGRKKH